MSILDSHGHHYYYWSSHSTVSCICWKLSLNSQILHIVNSVDSLSVIIHCCFIAGRVLGSGDKLVNEMKSWSSSHTHIYILQQMNKYMFDLLWKKKQIKWVENNRVSYFRKDSQGSFLCVGGDTWTEFWSEEANHMSFPYWKCSWISQTNYILEMCSWKWDDSRAEVYVWCLQELVRSTVGRGGEW